MAKKTKAKSAKKNIKSKSGKKYTCQTCGIIVSVDRECGCGPCDIVCCGASMTPIVCCK